MDNGQVPRSLHSFLANIQHKRHANDTTQVLPAGRETLVSFSSQISWTSLSTSKPSRGAPCWTHRLLTFPLPSFTFSNPLCFILLRPRVCTQHMTPSLFLLRIKQGRSIFRIAHVKRKRYLWSSCMLEGKAKERERETEWEKEIETFIGKRRAERIVR